MNNQNAIVPRSELVEKAVLISQKVTEELSKLRKITESKFKTNGMFSYNEENVSNAINIQKNTNLHKLLMIAAFICSRKDAYEAAVKDLKLKTFPVFVWCGYTYEEWLNDINIRVNVIMYEERKDKLESAQKTIQQYLPEENKIASDLEKLMELLEG